MVTVGCCFWALETVIILADSVVFVYLTMQLLSSRKNHLSWTSFTTLTVVWERKFHMYTQRQITGVPFQLNLDWSILNARTEEGHWSESIYLGLSLQIFCGHIGILVTFRPLHCQRDVCIAYQLEKLSALTQFWSLESHYDSTHFHDLCISSERSH